MRDLRPALEGARQVGLVALLVVLVVGVVTTILGITAVDAAQDDAAEWGVQAEPLLERLAEAWPAVEDAARRASAPVRSGGEDRAAFRELLAGTTPRAALQRTPTRVATFDMDTTAWARIGEPEVARPTVDPQLGWTNGSGAPVRMPDDVRMRYAADTTTPWLVVWRRAAVAAPPPAAWEYRVGVPGVDGLALAPSLGLQSYVALGRANAEAALLELERGAALDAASAVRRARENVAMAHVLARSPHPDEHVVGRAALREAALLLRFTGELASDSTAVADASRLGRALDRVGRIDFVAGARSPDADAAMQGALALAADHRLPPAVRATATVELTLSTCLTPTQVIASPTASLHASLRKVSARLADIDPEQRLRPAIERADVEWDAITRGGRWRRARLHPPAWSTVLDAAGLAGLTGRVMACAER